MHVIRVECRNALPSASTVAAAVFGEAGVIDRVDGNAWDRLVVTSSRQPSAQVRLLTLTRDPLVLEVASADPALAHAAAFHLAMETHGRFV